MSKETKIEWADSTLNFWSGCTKVSDGCKNCYAEALSNRKLGNIGGWGKGAPRKRHQSAFNLAFQLNKKPWVCDHCGEEFKDGDAPKHLCQPHNHLRRWHRRRVFSLSLGDWLDPEVPIEWLAEMLDVIRRCDQLEWLLVTKRPELWKTRMEQVVILENISDDLFQWVRLWLWQLKDENGDTPPHVMVLVSVENQKAADERIPALLAIPAARHGLSCEPLLGGLDLRRRVTIGGNSQEMIAQIDWVIVGGESGAGARPCNMEWIRSIGRQCDAAGVPCFVKQLGTKPESDFAVSRDEWLRTICDKKGGNMAEWPEDLRVREFPKV